MTEPRGQVLKVNVNPFGTQWLAVLDLEAEKFEWVDRESEGFYFDSYSQADKAADLLRKNGERGVHAMVIPARDETPVQANERTLRLERYRERMERQGLA